MKLISTVATLMIASFTLQAQDIKSSISGFSAQADIVYGEWYTNSFFLGNLSELEPIGGGLQFKIGYGFLERYEGFLSYSLVNYNVSEEWDRFINAYFKIGGRVYFGATLRRFRPYLEVSASSNSFIVDPIFIGMTEGPFELDMSGLGFSPGAGLNYFISPSFAVNVNVAFTFGSFTKVEISGVRNEFDETLDYTFFNVGLGLSYFFQ